jgi:hypothetical protein
MMVASLLLGWALPALAGGDELLAELLQLAGSRLSDQDLAAVSGRGAQHESSAGEPGRVIIWDEGPANSITFHNSLTGTGHGGTQTSTISINGH